MTTGRTPNIGLALPDFNEIPWHDLVNKNFRMLDSLILSLFGLTNVKGPWENSTAVTAGDRYFDIEIGQLYQVVTTHVTPAAPTTFAQDRIANPSRWEALGSEEAISAAAGALASAAAAAASQTAAAVSQTAATSSANAASSSASSASAAASAASGSASAAAASASAATSSAGDAATSAGTALANAAAALASAELAEDLAGGWLDFSGPLAALNIATKVPAAAVGVTESLTDCNNIINSGYYYIAPDAVNRPPLPTGQGGYLSHFRQYSDNYWYQFAAGDSLNTGIVYMRNCQGGAPSPWRGWLAKQQTFVPTTSGGQHDFTTIPNGVDSFRLLYDFSLSNASDVTVQLRTSPGGVITANYSGNRAIIPNGGAAAILAALTNGITLQTGLGINGGETVFRKLGDGTKWQATTQGFRASDNGLFFNNAFIGGLTNPVSGVRLSVGTGSFNNGGFYVEWG